MYVYLTGVKAFCLSTDDIIYVSSYDTETFVLQKRKLIITRTFKRDDGHLYTRSEVVSKPAVIDPYVKVRQSKDDAFM